MRHIQRSLRVVIDGHVRLLCAMALLTLAACAESQQPFGSAQKSGANVTTAPQTQPPELSNLLSKLDQIRQKNNVAAAAIALSSRNSVLYAGGLGVERHGNEQMVDQHTWFRLGSITKSFVGLTALGMSREQPDLFEQPVNALIPDLLSRANGGDTVRLPELLEHTAGLSDLSKREFDFQGATVRFADAILVDPGTRVLRWPASRHSSYSNAGFGYAGYVLETVGKRPFEELVSAQVLRPLGMKTAGFFEGDSTPTLAAGYDTDGVTPIPYWHMLYRSFGGLNASPDDMGRFVHGLLQPAPSTLFATPLERQRFENPHTTLAANAGLDYGYGLGNYHWFARGVRYHGHGGDADGYLSHYGYSTQSGYGYFVVITAFQKTTLNQMRDAIEGYLATLPELGSTVERIDAVRLPRRVLDRYAGNYVEVTRRFGPLSETPSLAVRVRRGQLVTVRGDRELTLEATSERLFRRPWQPAPTYAFVEHEGDVYLQGDMGNFRQVKSSSMQLGSSE